MKMNLNIRSPLLTLSELSAQGTNMIVNSLKTIDNLNRQTIDNIRFATASIIPRSGAARTSPLDLLMSAPNKIMSELMPKTGEVGRDFRGGSLNIELPRLQTSLSGVESESQIIGESEIDRRTRSMNVSKRGSDTNLLSNIF